MNSPAVAALLLATLVAGAAPAAATQADLARARTLYNQRQWDGAIDAARAARRTPQTADAAAVVLARAHLERYRERVDPADLSAARDAIGAARPDGLGARDRVELLLAMGEALFFEDDFGAAAELLATGLDPAAAHDEELHTAMLDWWASAAERQAAGLAPAARVAAFEALERRMQAELARNPGSTVAAYWVVMALRGQGEPERAWDAAVAGWVRARLAGDRAPRLRADLDRLVREGVIPDRIRGLPADRRSAAEAEARAEWELVKQRWQ